MAHGMPAGTKRRPARSFAAMPAVKARCCRSCTTCRRRSATCPAEAVPVIAEALNLTRAEVHGVVTLLSRLPRRAGRPPRAEALPRRGLPVDGRRARWRAQVLDASRASTGATRRRTARVTLEAGLLPRPVRLRAVGACSTASRSARLTPARDRRHRARGRPMTTRIFVPRDAAARAVGADEVAAAIVDEAQARGLDDRDRAHRLARPVLARADGRGRDAGGPHRLRAGDGRATCRACSTPACSSGGRIRCASAGRRRFPSSSARRASPSRAAASSIRCRSPTIARMAAGAASSARARLGAGGDRRGGHQVGPARPRRRGLPDRHQVEDRRRRARPTANTSSATPTRATAAPSPTA